MDLIQIIEDNLASLFEVEGLLSKLNKPDVSDSIVNFVPYFEPFLKQTAQIIKLKKESASSSTDEPRLCLSYGT